MHQAPRALGVWDLDEVEIVNPIFDVAGASEGDDDGTVISAVPHEPLHLQG